MEIELTENENIVLRERLLKLEANVTKARVSYSMNICSYAKLKEALLDFHTEYHLSKARLRWNV